MPSLPDQPLMANGSTAAAAAESDLAELGGEKPDSTAPVDAKVNGQGDGGFIEVPTNGGKSKRKRKGKSAEDRGPTGLPKSRGTGFEEFYADPPVTVEEYEEERELYSPTRSFDERIEECIQRFRGRRRLDNDRSNLFTKYLLLGGIDSSPRMFNGVAGMEKDLGGDMTGADIRAMAATDVITRSAGSSRFYNPNFPEHWDVDFNGVVSGYLSVQLPQLAGGEEALTSKGIDVVYNFLNYVLSHDVCPEYAEDVKKARATCARARIEIPLCQKAYAVLPGGFNLACSKLFLKKDEHDLEYFRGVYIDHDRLEDLDAEWVFKTAVAMNPKLLGPTVCKMVKNLDSIKVIKASPMTLEVCQIQPPKENLVKMYAGLKTRDGEQGKMRAMGLATFKHCVIEDGFDNPRPTAEELESRGMEAFLFEDNVLPVLQRGFKIQALVCELNCDLKFMAQILEIEPSYYTYLPQELMLNFKEHQEIDREPPSVDDPTAEEEVENQIIEDDIE